MSELIDPNSADTVLGVTRATLYSYVSRGLLRALPIQNGRGSHYLRHEVERLAAQSKGGRKPREAASHTLDFGLPVLPSSLCLIADNQLWYRGKNAVELAQTASLEDVAALLWQADPSIFEFTTIEPDAHWQSMQVVLRDTPLFDRSLALFAYAASRLHVLAPEASIQEQHARAANLLQLMARSLLASPANHPGTVPQPLHQQCAAAWQVDDNGAQLIRRALVLCADHELNASSFTARCVASTKSSLHAAIIGGLAALSGRRHGAATEQLEDLWDQAATRSVKDLIANKPQHRRGVAGFGHRLYPIGDPRAISILQGLKVDAAGQDLCEAVMQTNGEEPSVDFALVALRRHLNLPRGAALVIFALARTVGWIAHAFEQKEDGHLIRPRAQYLGIPAPRPTPSSRVLRMGKPK